MTEQRVLTPEEVEQIGPTNQAESDLIATVHYYQRRAEQTRRLADDYKRLLGSQREDLDAVLKASIEVYLAAKSVLGNDEYDSYWRDLCANLQWKLRSLRRVMKAAGVVLDPD